MYGPRMFGLECLVNTCSNSSLACKKSGKKISFHRFPCDPRLKHIWKKNCGIEKNYNLDRSSICSEHFAPSAFLHTRKGQSPDRRDVVKLVQGAIPTLNLPAEHFERPTPIGVRSRENETMPELRYKEAASSLSSTEEFSDGENDVIILEITSIAGKHQSTKVIEPSAKKRRTCTNLQETFDSDQDSSHNELDNNISVSTSFDPDFSDNDELDSTQSDTSDPDGVTEAMMENSKTNKVRRKRFFFDHGESSAACDNIVQRLEFKLQNESDTCDPIADLIALHPHADSAIVLPTNPLPVLVKQGKVKKMMLLGSSPEPQHGTAKPMPVLVNQGKTSQLMYLQDIPAQPNSQPGPVSSCSSREVSSAENVLLNDDGGSARDRVTELNDGIVCSQNEEPTHLSVLSSKLKPLIAPSTSVNLEYDISPVKNAESSSPVFVSPDKAMIDRLHKRIQQMEDKVKVQNELYKKRLRAANLKHRLKVVQLNERIQSLQYQLHDVPEVVRKGTYLGSDSETIQNDKTRKAISLDVWKLLNKTFTDNEIKAICDKERQIRWKDSELLKAYTLRCLSYGAYVFVREKLKYPLPSTKYLTRWLTGIQKKKGLVDNESGVQGEVIDVEDLQDFDEEIYIESVDSIDEAINSDEN